MRFQHKVDFFMVSKVATTQNLVEDLIFEQATEEGCSLSNTEEDERPRKDEEVLVSL